jgi:hypothetical protein
MHACYSQLAVVSDVDNGGVCPECQQRKGKFCRAITKQVQWSNARIKVDRMHTRWMNALSKCRGCIEVQSLVKECTTREDRVQGLVK